MAEATVDAPPLRLTDLADYLAAGCRPPAEFKVGAEHEKFGFRQATLRPIPYEGAGGVEALLKGMMRFGWQGDYEARDGGETLIALTRNGASLSLEPGGQFELSGAPLAHHARHLRGDRASTSKEAKAVAGRTRPRLPRPRLLARSGAATTCPSCPRAATRSCATTCPRSAAQRARHDVPHLHRAGQPRLRLRSRHGGEVPRAAWPCSPWPRPCSPIRPSPKAGPTAGCPPAPAVWTDTDADRTGLLDFVFEDGFGFRGLRRPTRSRCRCTSSTAMGRYIDVAGRVVPPLSWPASSPRRRANGRR